MHQWEAFAKVLVPRWVTPEGDKSKPYKHIPRRTLMGEAMTIEAKKKSDIVLPNTTLCAIVRDEKMNPAGGVERWLDSTLPYVEEAVVVDTGSVDGTREILKEMQSKYQHLRVYDHKWKGFADARNRSLEEARTKRVLILDADEIIADEDKSISGAFRTLNLLARNTTNYHITSEHIGFPGEGYRSSTTSTLRFLSEPDKLSYGGIVFEDLKNIGYIDLTSSIIKNGVRIRHFLPRKELSRKKSKFWYGPFHLVERGEAEFTDRHPIEFANRDGWKEYNPRRDEFS